MRWLIVLSALATAGAWAGSWETSSYRTPGGDLIQRGMNTTEVLQRAGDPVQRRVLGSKTTASGKPKVTREIWVYRGGDGSYSLTFVNQRLERIEVTPRR